MNAIPGIVTAAGELLVNLPDKFDVIVIGGGPIGGTVAKTTVERGLKTIVLEEHGTIGLPVHCAGIISIDGLRKLGTTLSKRLVLNKVRGATVFSPSGAKLTIERQSEQACVVDRALLDREIMNEATGKGAILVLNAKARSIEIRSEDALVAAEVSRGRVARESMKLKGRLVISCVGALANLSHQIGLDRPNPRMRLYATQFEMSNISLDREDIVQIYLGRRYAPGFFAWIIPIGSDSARVGLASKIPSALTSLRHFALHHPVASKLLTKAKITKTFGGIVLTGGPTRRTFSDRALVVGDCAGQTKPTTGGGVVTGETCAKIAGKVAAESVAAHDFSEAFLEKYQKMWKRKLGREFSTMLRMRRLLNLLPDALIDRIVHTSRISGLADLMEKKGDIDLQSDFLKAVTRSPKIIIAPVLSLLGIL